MSGAGTETNDSVKTGAAHTREVTEFLSALLMALTAVASAWCGYQATVWNGQQSILIGETAALRFEASRKLTLAGQEALIDIGTFEQLHRALIEGRTAYVERTLKRFRPEARAAVDAWLATDPLKNPSAPPGPFRMQEYRSRRAEEAEALDHQASGKFAQARSANSNVDLYTMVTTMLASILLFAGISTHFTSTRIQRGVLLMGLLLFLSALLLLARLPVA